MRRLLGNRLYLSLFGVIAILVIAVAYLYSGVLGLPLTHRAPTVTVDLTSTGGLYEGSPATYRGVKVGKVTKIALGGPSGVQATVELTSQTPIPADTLARVRSLSPVGEQYVDFEPRTSAGPYLHDGSVIKASSTDLPDTLGSTVIAVNKLLKQVPPAKLHRVLDAFATGLGGTGDDLGSSIDQARQVLTDLRRVQPQTNELINQLSPALDLGLQHAGDLRSLGVTAKEWTTYLDSYRSELLGEITRAPRELHEVQRLVVTWQNELPLFLPNALRLGSFLVANEPALRALLATYAPGLATVGEYLHGGRLNVDVIAAKDTRCSYTTTQHDPRTAGTTMQPNKPGCGAGTPNLQRGAAHAPSH